MFSYPSPLFSAPLKLSCSIRRNSLRLRFLDKSLGTCSHLSNDWLKDKLLSSLSDDKSWSTISVGSRLLDDRFKLGLIGGGAPGRMESLNKRHFLIKTCFFAVQTVLVKATIQPGIIYNFIMWYTLRNILPALYFAWVYCRLLFIIQPVVRHCDVLQVPTLRMSPVSTKNYVL